MEFNVIDQLQNHNSITSWWSVFAISTGIACLVGWSGIKIMKLFSSQKTHPETVESDPRAIDSYRGQLLNKTDNDTDDFSIQSIAYETMLSRLQRLSSKLESLTSDRYELPELSPEEYAAGLDLEFIQKSET
jgi:hypothetical protein